MDSIDLKQRLGLNLSGCDKDALFATVLYFCYRTIEHNTTLTVKKLKALLCVEYLLSESLVEAAVSVLISRSMFNCVTRYRPPDRPVSDMSISVVKPPPVEFEEWLLRTEARYPELLVFDPPKYQQKKCEGVRG